MSRQLTATGLTVSLILLILILSTGNPGVVQIEVALFTQLENSLLQLNFGMPDVSWLPVVVMIFLVASLGMRSLGFLSLTLISKSHQLFPLVLFLCLYLACGYAISETMFIGRKGGQNNAIWFYVQSLMAAWFLLFIYLQTITIKRVYFQAICIAILALSSISTIQFLSLRSNDEYWHFGPGSVEVIRFLQATEPESVVLHPLNSKIPSLASNFAGRSSVLNLFRSFVVAEDGVDERVRDINTFFDPTGSVEDRMEIIDKYGAAYVYLPSNHALQLDDIPNSNLLISNQEWNVLELHSQTSVGKSEKSL